jgi:hypothetical protein
MKSLLQSRAQRGPRRAFFARWGGQRGNPIAKKVLEVLLYLKSRAERETSIAKKALEVQS